MSKRRCIALETLFTFCPPAPWARIALISISLAGMVTPLEICIMLAAAPGTQSPGPRASDRMRACRAGTNA